MSNDSHTAASRLTFLADSIGWNLLHSFADQVLNGRTLSARQMEVVAKAEALLAKRNAEKEALANVPVPEGRTSVTFRIVKFKESSFRFHGGMHGVSTSIKVVGVMANGVKVWGTLPDAIANDAKEGDSVTLTATFTKKDAGFATFSRPSNATLAVA
ncbi:MAG: hypothetical protein EBU83_01960 [bacterium]|jgi:hypothetical protein|nr:hypothetical protein [Candidatus Aquidulcis sp.]